MTHHYFRCITNLGRSSLTIRLRISRSQAFDIQFHTFNFLRSYCKSSVHVQRGFPVLLSPYLFACNIRFGCLSPLILSTCLAYLKWSNFEMAKCPVPRITHSARDYNCSITLRFQTRSRRWCDMYLPLPNTKTLEVTHDKMKLIGKSIIFAWKSLIGRRVDNSSWFQLEKSH